MPGRCPAVASCLARSSAMRPATRRPGARRPGHDLSRGWHSGVVFGTLSAAVSAGTLYGLDAARFEDALGMAATQSWGLMAAQFESMVKRMQHGFASRMTAAAPAASGYVGIKRVFEREYGGYLGTGVRRFYQPKAAIADLMVMPPMRVRRISRPMAARKTCGICSAGGTRDHRVRVFSRPCRVRRMTSPSAMRCDQRKPISWK